MPIVIKRGKIYHIQYYIASEKKIKSISTGLLATSANLKLAKNYAKQLQKELSNRNAKMKELGIKKISIKDAKDHFEMNQEQKHKKTKDNFARTYSLLKEFINEEAPCTQLNKIIAEEFILSIKKRDWQPNTKHTYFTHFNHFLNFLFEYNYTPMFKINRDVKTKPEVKEKVVFSDPHIKKILRNLNVLNENQICLVKLLLYTGLRPSDILSLTGDKIDLKSRKMNYYSSKTKKFRTVCFHDKLYDMLCSRKKEVGIKKILNYDNVESISRAVSRFMEYLNLHGKGYSARTFRKTFITLCRNRFGIEDAIVRELVGHSQGNVPDKFYNHIDLKTLKKELKKFKLPGA